MHRYQRFHIATMLERAVELSLALEYLHHDVAGGAGTSFIVHRDLKPDNGKQSSLSLMRIVLLHCI
jgi:serine/threonine protein kinase